MSVILSYPWDLILNVQFFKLYLNSHRSVIFELEENHKVTGNRYMMSCGTGVKVKIQVVHSKCAHDFLHIT